MDKRKLTQIVSSLLQNINIKGFLTGTIYKGLLKHFCVPSINCYSCPGAIGACPIGSMQVLLGSKNKKAVLYIFGFLALIGISVGRFICGWLCLFGLIQELLYKIPTPKIKMPKKIDKVLRYLKYILLIVFVILLPFTLQDEFGVSIPFFCKYICPVGTLEGAGPLMAFSSTLRSAAHLLFTWKLIILLIIIILSIFIYRPFCKYICPLGAFYSLFQRVSFLKLQYNKSKCILCGKCSRACKMGIDPTKTPNSTECIRCGECVKSCETNALKFNIKKEKTDEKN